MIRQGKQKATPDKATAVQRTRLHPSAAGWTSEHLTHFCSQFHCRFAPVKSSPIRGEWSSGLQLPSSRNRWNGYRLYSFVVYHQLTQGVNKTGFKGARAGSWYHLGAVPQPVKETSPLRSRWHPFWYNTLELWFGVQITAYKNFQKLWDSTGESPLHAWTFSPVKPLYETIWVFEPCSATAKGLRLFQR